MKTITLMAALAVLATPSWAQGGPPAQDPGPIYPIEQGSLQARPTPPPYNFSPPAAPASPSALPDGVDQLYALEGTNTLLATATPEGYERLRELVRNIDGDLDIVQTKVVSVTLSTSDLTALGTSVGPSTGLVSPTDAAKLQSALQTGRLMADDTLRITTRENTPVDTLLRLRGARFATGGTPFSLVPRETSNGSLTLEILQPLSATVSVTSGETAVLATPGMKSDTVRLLFLTPAVLPSSQRPVR